MFEGTAFLGGRVRLHAGDNRAVLATLPDAAIDACVTDPPYALVSIVKRFGKEGSAEAKSNGATGVYKRASSGFMGKAWDTGEVAFDPAFWAEVCRVLKPGAHLVAFGGTRSYHRLACAIEDAGFEVRDQIGWAYGSGFPKSHNAGNGWGTALKPAWEPIILARKPLIGTVAANVEAHGTGALNIDGCRVATADNLNGGTYSPNGKSGPMPGDERTGAALGMFQAGARPAHDYVQPAGRWPANIVHDGSEEVLAAFPDAPGAYAPVGPQYGPKDSVNAYGNWGPREQTTTRGDSGSASRFFYCAKADANDRIGSKHPTVKPVGLMRWLCRLVTPKDGTILDPFAGTGTTGQAAHEEGFSAILIEREAEYVADIERRMRLVMAGPDERSREIAKAKGNAEPLGGLFAKVAPI